MPRLPAGRRACVEHPACAWGVEQRGRELGRFVLDRNQSFLEAGDGLHRPRRFQGHPVGRVRGPRGRDAVVRQLVEVAPARDPHCIDPEGHRRPFQIGAGDGFPRRRPGTFERSEQPGRMREPGARRELGAQDGVALGREASQRRVRETGCPRLADGSGQVDRRADRGVRRHPREPELVQPEQDEGADLGVARRMGRNPIEPRIQTGQIAQGSQHQLPGECLVSRIEPRVEGSPPARPERAAVPEHAGEQCMGHAPRGSRRSACIRARSPPAHRGPRTKRVPALRRRPRTNSAADMRRAPGG